MISVIVPIYNAEKYLTQCIESIIHQTYENLEIILVDDGSTDGSYKICAHYADFDKRIKIIRKENEGLVRARKTGIEYANGEYVTFVDADDWIDLDTYENILKELKSDNTDMLLCGLIEEYEDETVTVLNLIPSGYYDGDEIKKHIYPYMLCGGNFFEFGILPNLVCKLVKLDLIKKVQYAVSDNVNIGEDADCTFQMLLQAQSLQITDLTPYHYRKRQESMMWKKSELQPFKSLFLDLRIAFDNCKEKKILLPQLYRYMLFVLLLKMPETILERMGYNLSNDGRKIALYGAGGFGQAVYQFLEKDTPNPVMVWVDKKYKLYNNRGLPVHRIEDLLCADYEEIFIAVLNVKICESIKDHLIEMGIEETKINFINPSVEISEAVVKTVL